MITEDDDEGAAPDLACPSCGKTATDPTFVFCTFCGARLDGGTGVLVPAAKDDTKRMALPQADPLDEADRDRSWWARHRKALVIGAAAVLLVGAGGYVGWQWQGFRTAHGPVEAFFAALEDRDGPAAAALLAETVFLNNDTLATDEEILASPIWEAGALDTGYLPPELHGVEVEYFMDVGEVDQRPDKSLSRAIATFGVGGQDYTMKFLMARETEGVSREWSIEAITMGAVPISSTVQAAQVANTYLTDDPYVPPGIYDVSISGNPLFEDASGQVTIGGEGLVDGKADRVEGPSALPSTAAPPEVASDAGSLSGGAPLDGAKQHLIVTSTLTYELRPEATGEIESQIRQAIDVCAAPHQLDWDTCPYTLVGFDKSIAPSTASALEGGSAWAVEAYPEINLVIDDWGMVKVQVTAPGKATGEYLGPEDGPGLVLLWKDYEAELKPYGRVSIDRGAIVWTYRP